MTNNANQIALIVAAVITALNAQKSSPKAASHTPRSSYKAANKFTPKGSVDKSDRKLRNDVAVAKAFKNNGLLVTPRVDALTYKGWLSKGQRPVKGSKGLFVKGVGTLFHSGQVAPDLPISLITGQPVNLTVV